VNFTDKNTSGYFEICREPSSLSFESFWNKYVVMEQPFIIENAASDWKAKSCWTENYLQKRLSEEPLAKEAFLWYWMQKNALIDDYNIPEIVEKTIDHNEVFPRSQVMRIWVHEMGNLSSWHYVPIWLVCLMCKSQGVRNGHSFHRKRPLIVTRLQILQY
jgi:hypothetical protein